MLILKDLESLLNSVHAETKWVKCYSWPFFPLHPNAALVHLALVSAALYLPPPSTASSRTVPSFSFLVFDIHEFQASILSPGLLLPHFPLSLLPTAIILRPGVSKSVSLIL